MSTPENPAAPRGARRRRAMARLRDRRVLTVLAIALVGLVVARWYFAGRESTENAKVNGSIHPVAPRIAGTVVAVAVSDNQEVEAGQVLFEIDQRDYRVAFEAAAADAAVGEAGVRAAESNLPVSSTSINSRLESVRAQLESSTTGVRLAEQQRAAARARFAALEASVEEARSYWRQASSDLERLTQLVEKDEISAAEHERAATAERAARARLRSLDAALEAAKQEVEIAKSRLAQALGSERSVRAELEAAETAPQQVAVTEAEVEAARARLRQAQAKLSRAELDLEYTKVRAPAAGRVTSKRLEVGQVVAPGRPVMAIVVLDDVWVEAKFKETQLRRMRPGQRARIEVDTYAGRVFDARVESIAAATSAKFSLLPAENATGNFVKVVQRVPVKLVFTEPADPDRPLRPGMSVVATVITRDRPPESP